MKRIIKLSLALCLIVLSILIVTSCGGTKMNAPGGVRIDVDTQMVKWNKVSGAYSYDVMVGDGEITNTKGNYLSLEYLDPGKYEVKVRAVSLDEKILPSDWKSVEFTREAETGLKYKLINNRTEYELIGAGSAFGDVVMESTYRGKPVTSIAKQALAKNKKITSFVIGNNVKVIGEGAFTNSSALTSVTIPESVVEIGQYAFQSCKALATVKFSAKVSEIAPYTFSWCSALTGIEIGETVNAIGDYAFSNCTQLSTLKIGKNVASIGEYAFSDCLALGRIDLPAVKTISAYAFYNCKSAEAITFGEGLVSVGDAAFTNCVKITEIALPETAATIGIESFAGCTLLGKVTVGDGITGIGTNAFADTKLYAEGGDTVYIGGWIIANKNKSIKNIVLKEGTYGIGASVFSECNELSLFNLTGIKYVGDGAFYGCAKLNDVKFDSTLLKLGNYAFASCVELLYVDIGTSLTHIGDYAFFGCTKLTATSIKDLPDSLVSIGTYAFHGTQAYNSASNVVYVHDWAVGLKEGLYRGMEIKNGTRGIANYSFYNALILGQITIPNSVQYIGRAAFYGCMNVQMFNIPTSVKEIGDYAFYACSIATFGPFVSESNPTTVFPNTLTYIGRSAFYECATLVGVAIPGSVKEIGDYAFYKCENLGESELVSAQDPTTTVVGKVIIANGVERIGEKAFYGCIRMADIIIPDSVKTIGDKAFYKCENLRSLTIGNGVEKIPDYAFYKCFALAEVSFGTGLREIGRYAFRGCEALVKINLPEGLLSVGANAFTGCSSAISLTLPSTLTSIGDYAFRGLNKVKSIILPSTVKTIGKHAFYGCSTATIYTDAKDVLPEWSERFNSAYRPIVFGCTLSEDYGYVVSFKTGKDAIDNTIAESGALICERDGYEFIGWAENPDAEAADYTAAEAITAPEGKTLYSIFKEIIKAD